MRLYTIGYTAQLAHKTNTKFQRHGATTWCGQSSRNKLRPNYDQRHVQSGQSTRRDFHSRHSYNGPTVSQAEGSKKHGTNNTE